MGENQFDSLAQPNMNSKLLLAVVLLACVSFANAGWNNRNNRNLNREYGNGRNGYNNHGKNSDNRCRNINRFYKSSFSRQYSSSLYHQCWYGGTYTARNGDRISCSNRNGRGYLSNVQICSRY